MIRRLNSGFQIVGKVKLLKKSTTKVGIILYIKLSKIRRINFIFPRLATRFSSVF